MLAIRDRVTDKRKVPGTVSSLEEVKPAKRIKTEAGPKESVRSRLEKRKLLNRLLNK
jgi:hypothetical protein